MTALLASEIRRMRSRRLYRWLAGLATLGFVIGGVAAFVNDSSFRLTEMPGFLKGLAFPLVMLAWVVGASAIGAEWQPRTISALLTWEPRRGRVLLAKVVAATVYAAVFVVVLQIVFTLTLLPAAGSGGGSWLEEHALTGGRILFVAAIAAVVGFALATIGKNTAAALGGGFAYILVVENLVRGFLPDWSDWLLGTNMGRVVEGREGFGLGSHSTEGAAVILVVYAVGLFLLALGIFRRREIA